jgi:hypothetical protein
MSETSTQQSQQLALVAYANGLDEDDLARLTNEMIDSMLGMIAGCTDADVVFVPDDPEAYDEYAENEADLELAWTLGHVIVHTTASAEEAAFLAAELARGVEMRVRRSRWEVPWQTVTTIAQCRQRLEESRRMRLASLAMWPDEPNLENHYVYRRTDVPINAKTRFAFGLAHDESHVEQIAEIVRQAKQARAG